MDKNQSSDEDVSKPDGNHLPSEEMDQVPVHEKRKTVLPEPELGECSTSAQAVNQEESASTSEAITERKDSDKKVSINAAEWPDFVLKLIFRFLCFCDLVNVQKVCKSWEEATEDSAVWRHIVVSTQNIEVLPTVPYVQTIKGDIYNESQLNVIKNNVYDLKKIDFMIEIKNFSSTTFQKFIKKFQNLEFIKISNSTFFMEYLELLSNFPKLKALHLRYNPNLENFPHFCRLFADGFPALRDLRIDREYSSEDGKDYLSELLRKKISQLTELNLSTNDVHSSILDLIFESTKMEKICIHFKNFFRISLNLSKMIYLKSLNLQFTFSSDYDLSLGNNFAHPFETLVFPNNLNHLSLVFHSSTRSPPGVINSIINFLPNLRVLFVVGVRDPDIDKQLEHLQNLQHLHTVTFYWCVSLSAVGVENILKCTQLRKLILQMCDFFCYSTFVSFDDTTYDHLQDCKFLGDLELHNCILDLEKLLPTILAMRYLTNLNIRRCKGKNTTGELIVLRQSVIADIIETCKNEKHNVKIIC